MYDTTPIFRGVGEDLIDIDKELLIFCVPFSYGKKIAGQFNFLIFPTKLTSDEEMERGPGKW
jgi:hypothetical protein